MGSKRAIGCGKRLGAGVGLRYMRLFPRELRCRVQGGGGGRVAYQSLTDTKIHNVRDNT